MISNSAIQEINGIDGSKIIVGEQAQIVIQNHHRESLSIRAI